MKDCAVTYTDPLFRETYYVPGWVLTAAGLIAGIVGRGWRKR